MNWEVKILLFFISLSNVGLVTSQNFYKSTAVAIEFYSSAPVEDIKANSEEGVAVWNVKTGEISFKVKIRSFRFEKELMREHFNENYLESDEIPDATFKGKIKEPVELSGNKEIPVTITGTLEVHGIKKNRNIPALLTIKNGQVNLKSEFKVACKDHDIKIPKLLWKNIAEVVRVRVNANFSKL